MRIISKRTHHEETDYFLSFVYTDMPSAGFSFPCDKLGSVDESKLTTASRASYNACLAGAVRRSFGGQCDRDGNYIAGTATVECATVKAMGVEARPNRWTDPAIGECNHCGAEVQLSGFTNTCDCGTDYNMSGQELASREQWGEETGETVADILSVDRRCSAF
jgi:hypothetical protein